MFKFKMFPSLLNFLQINSLLCISQCHFEKSIFTFLNIVLKIKALTSSSPNFVKWRWNLYIHKKMYEEDYNWNWNVRFFTVTKEWKRKKDNRKKTVKKQMKQCHNTIIKHRGIKLGQPPLQESASLDANQECNHSSRLTQSGIRRLYSVQHVLNNKVKYHQPATLPLSARQPKCRSSYIKTSSRRI